MNPSPVELPELLQRLKVNCLGGVRDGTRLRVQCEMVLCDVSEPAGPGVHLYECWTERRNGDGVVKEGQGEGEDENGLQPAANEERVLEMKAPAAWPGLTKASLILGLPTGLVASLATGTSLIVAS